MPAARRHAASETSFYRDQENILWIGTSGRGLFSARRQTITTLAEEQGLQDDNIHPIYEDRAGAVWIGAWPFTLNRHDYRGFSHFDMKDGLSANIASLLEDRSGRLWVGAYSPTSDGLRIFEKGRFVPPPAPLRNLGVVRTIFQDRAGALWFGCEEKLVRYRGGSVQSFTTKDGLASNFVSVLAEDQPGNLWIGGVGGLSRYDGQRFTAFTVRDGLPSPSVRALYVDPENLLWIGTYDGGLGRYDGVHFTRITTKNGLFSNGVFQILGGRERLSVDEFESGHLPLQETGPE